MRPSYSNMFRVFGRIGLLSFGGPAAQISLMHRELVEERAWLNEASYLRALSLCMMLPGPEAMQLATYAGWRLRGVWGGLLAGLLFVIPGALIIAVLALSYAVYGDLPLVQAAFLGIKAAVIIIVVQALIRLSKKALGSRIERGLAGFAFLAIFVFGVPFPAVILCAAVIGVWRMVTPTEDIIATSARVPLSQTMKTIAIWSVLWATPLALALWLDPDFLGPLGVFFSKLAVVTFGGAYAVLAYMTQTVVSDFGWLSTAQMIDALGLAETTPGPLILVTQFVAMLAGISAQGWALGLVAGALALWVTFVPCFLWIFVAAPYMETLAQRPIIGASLRAITAAVVGVIAQLALWFALHVLFQKLGQWHAMPLPDPSSLNVTAVGLVGISAVLLIWRNWSVPTVLATMAMTSVVVQIILG